jgi:hypothetical protein
MNGGTLLFFLVTPWSRVLLEKLTGLQIVKKFPAFHGTRMFITAFTSARHLSQSSASSIQFIPPHPTSWRSILILSSHLRLGLPSGLLIEDNSRQNTITHPYQADAAGPSEAADWTHYVRSVLNVLGVSCGPQAVVSTNFTHYFGDLIYYYKGSKSARAGGRGAHVQPSGVYRTWTAKLALLTSIQGDQKVSEHLTITVQKTSKNILSSFIHLPW